MAHRIRRPARMGIATIGATLAAFVAALAATATSRPVPGFAATPNADTPSQTQAHDPEAGSGLPAAIEVRSALYDTAQLPTASVRTYMVERGSDGAWQPTFGSDGPQGQVVNKSRRYGVAVDTPESWTYDSATNRWNGTVEIEISAHNIETGEDSPVQLATAHVSARVEAVTLREHVPGATPIYSPTDDWHGGSKTFPLDPSARIADLPDVYDLGEQALIRTGCHGMHAEFTWQLHSTFSANIAGLGNYEFASRRRILTDNPYSAVAVAVKSAIAADEGVDTSADLNDRCHPESSTGFADVEIIKAPEPPTAVIKADPDAGPASPRMATVLDGSDSSDPDGDIVEYQWSYRGRGVADAVTAEPTIPTTYARGTHTAQLRVKDDDGLLSDWASVSICAAGAPDAWVPWWHQYGRVPHANALVRAHGYADPDCPGHPHGPDIVYARFSWDSRDRHVTEWRGRLERLRWHYAGHMYEGHYPPPEDEYPNWYAYGRGWRWPHFVVVDSFGQSSNVVAWPLLINTPPKGWMGIHFCEPRPCSNNRRRAHIQAWSHDDTPPFAVIGVTWRVWNSRGAQVHGGTEWQSATAFDKWITYETGVPYVIQEVVDGHDADGEWMFRRDNNWYQHNADHSPTNVRFLWGR